MNTNAVESVCSFTKLDENNSEQDVGLEFKMRTDVIFDFIKNCQALKFHQLVTNKKLLKFPSSTLTDMDEQDLSIQNLNSVLTYFMFAPYINSIKNTFIVPTDAHCYKIIGMLKQYKNYNTCSDTFRFTREPSSGSSPVLS